MLTIDFQNGTVYEYYMVPRTVFEAFLAAPSKGEFFLQEVRGKFRDRKARG